MSEATYDDLTGVVDLFGALIREELETALDKLTFRQGRETDGDALSGMIFGAIDAYYLVPYEDDKIDAELPTVGPMTFLTFPDRAEDLPRVLDYPIREVPQSELATQAESRLRAAATSAVQTGDADEIECLLDMTYDLKTWADTDVGSIREYLDATLDAEGQAQVTASLYEP